MNKKYLINGIFISLLIAAAMGLSSCSRSSNDTSSGGGTGPGGGPGHGVSGTPGSPVMSAGQQIPQGQEVHIHETGQYQVSVQSPTTMTLECEGRVEYVYTHGGQTENGVCENQTLSIPVSSSGTMHFNLGPGADMGLELH